jgi:ubiquinone/menaquinone biosynthesis C-methylase UbiE
MSNIIERTRRVASNWCIASEKKFWEKIYKEDETHWLDKDVSKLTKDAVKRYGPFKNILEIGSAGGIDTFYLAKHTQKIIGIDLVEDAVETAKQNLKNQSDKVKEKVKFQVGDVEKLKFPDSHFDFIYSLSVLHSTNISKSLKEIHRVLTDDGHAVLYVFIGKGKEKVVKNHFLDVCKEYFTVEDQEEVAFQDKEDKHEKENHKALIVFLKVLK